MVSSLRLRNSPEKASTSCKRSNRLRPKATLRVCREQSTPLCTSLPLTASTLMRRSRSTQAGHNCPTRPFIGLIVCQVSDAVKSGKPAQGCCYPSGCVSSSGQAYWFDEAKTLYCASLRWRRATSAGRTTDLNKSGAAPHDRHRWQQGACSHLHAPPAIFVL